MAKITKQNLENLVANTTITGAILVKDFQIALTKTGKEYISGTLSSGIDVFFKAWGNSTAFNILKNLEERNIVMNISGKVDNHNGVNSIIVETVTACNEFKFSDFLDIKYDINAYYNALVDLVKNSVSEKGFEICNNVLFNNNNLVSRFKEEFAAKSHHDNCYGGLLAHTYKVVRLAVETINMYPGIIHSESDDEKSAYKDLIVIGSLLHDIGKTVEMEFGVYQPKSVVTHRYLGLEFITPYKEAIIESYDEIWYYELVSILLQHHGEYGDPCKSLVAYVVHKVDCFDADMTLLAQTVSENKPLKIDNNYLTKGGK